MSAFRLSGLTTLKNIMFQVIIPKEKNKIAAPETLLRSLGNWDHRQLMMGIVLREKQVIGKKTKKTARVTKLNLKFSTNGMSVKRTAQILITVL